MRNTAHSIGQEIRRRVVSGHWKPGTKIASEKDLAKDFNVCPATIQKSLQGLQREGLITSKQGVGRFVQNPDCRPKTGLVNIVVLHPSHVYHPVMSQIVQGISEVVNDKAYHMRLSALRDKDLSLAQFNEEAQWNRLFSPSDVDGAIITTQFLSRRAVEWLADRVPVVSLNNLNAHPHISCVQPDMIAGAFQAVRHLIGLGHRHIAALTTNKYCVFGQQQQDGIRLAMLGFSAPDESSMDILEADDFSVEEGRRLSRKWLSNPPRSTAVFCGSDDLALGFHEVASSAGVRIPEEVSLVSTNDTLTSAQIPLEVTSVRSDHQAWGRMATARLFEMIAQPFRLGDFQLVPSELVIRDSCKPFISRT